MNLYRSSSDFIYREAVPALVQFSGEVLAPGQVVIGVNCDQACAIRSVSWSHDVEPAYLLDLRVGGTTWFLQRTQYGVANELKLPPECALKPGEMFEMTFDAAPGRIRGVISLAYVRDFGHPSFDEEEPAAKTHERFTPNVEPVGVFSRGINDRVWRVVETDNYDRDYPNEAFHGPMMTFPDAQKVCTLWNSVPGDRWYKVEHREYKLVGGFEP